jgi:hypothetical protein
MYDFIERAARIHRRGESHWARFSFDQVMQARRKLQVAYAKSSIDLDNIENLFTTFEMASLIGKLANIEKSKVSELPKNLRYLIMRTIEQSILFPIDSQNETIQPPYPYGLFCELLTELSSVQGAAPIAVINFNYDLCLDYALTVAGKQIFYGLARDVPNGAFHHYKVHGSLNWFRDLETGEVAAERLTPLPTHRYWERLGLDQPADRPIDTMEVIHGPGIWGEEFFPEPIIVPPTWNKGWYQEQLKSVWRAASEALSTAENIVVIGYSLPPSDQFFRSFYSLSTISDSIIDNFWLFDPTDNDDVVERYRGLLGPAIITRDRFKFHSLKFSSAIRFIAEEYGFSVNDYDER